MFKIICIAFLFLVPELSTITPQPRDLEWWVARTAQLQKVVDEVGSNANVIFVGDSITQGWEGNGAAIWKEHLAPLHAINLGIGGDRTEHVLWRLENGHLHGLTPEVAVVMIGTNNFGHDTPDTPAEVLEGIVAVVEKLKSSLPDVHVLLLDIFPRGRSFNQMRGSILQVNQALKTAYAKDDRVTFFPIGDLFIEDDGSIHQAIMPDYLHLSEKGYQIWFGAISTELNNHLNTSNAPPK
ncbi:MAG TPA: GDSL family lipase [Phycisphaerales bacterium]|nr:GDSL family lipase [Phycisphaerales bacterium]